MRIRTIPAIAITLFLCGAGPALADPAATPPPTEVSTSVTVDKSATPTTDEAAYTAREAGDSTPGAFAGGSTTIYVASGGGLLLVLLLVLLLL